MGEAAEGVVAMHAEEEDETENWAGAALPARAPTLSKVSHSASW